MDWFKDSNITTSTSTEAAPCEKAWFLNVNVHKIIIANILNIIELLCIYKIIQLLILYYYLC